MQCPHCRVSFHENWQLSTLTRLELLQPGNAQNVATGFQVRTAHCPECKKFTIELTSKRMVDWLRVFPRGNSRAPVPPEVPEHIAQDYTEACEVLPISAKASAALSRRCLQTMLHEHGYKARDLYQEIDLILNEKDAAKAIPNTLRNTIDGIRHFGNFSAHPITDLTTLQIIDVEPHEAEYCLETIEEMFEHFYVRPAVVKKRREELDAKLAAAGKPASK